MCVLEVTVLRGEEGTGEPGHSSGCRCDDVVGSDVPGVDSSRIGSSLDRGSRSVNDLERILDDQESRLDLNGSDSIRLGVSALRWVTLSGDAR